MSVAMQVPQVKSQPPYHRGQPPAERYKKKASELLTSEEEGIKHRGRRCIEPEAVFGQMKTDIAYKRFCHFGKDKVTMDLPSSPSPSTSRKCARR